MEAIVPVTNTLWLGQKGHWNIATVQRACFPLPKENGKEQATTTGRSLQAQLLRSPTSLPFTEPARSSPARKQRKTLGWWWSYQEPIPYQWQTLSHTAVNSKTSTLPPLPAYQATGSTSSIHLNANQSKSSAIQLQTGVFSNLNQVAKLLPTHCFTPAGQPRGLVAF